MTIKLSDVTNIFPEKRGHKEDTRIVLTNCFVGIEIEAENCIGREKLQQNSKIRGFWDVTRDGSLRNNGVEFISNKLVGRDIITALDALINTVKGSGEDLLFSERTSTHIHVDFRGFTTGALVKLVILYCIFEEFLFSLVDESRQNNNHARKIITNNALARNISLLCADDKYSVEDGLVSWPKYTAMNLNPIIRQGSVEFRHLEGTYDKDKILNWINILLSLKKYVIYTSLPAQRIIDMVCEDPEGLFNTVFVRNKDLWKESIVKGMLEGARYVQANITVLPNMFGELFGTGGKTGDKKMKELPGYLQINRPSRVRGRYTPLRPADRNAAPVPAELPDPLAREPAPEFWSADMAVRLNQAREGINEDD